MDAKAPKQSFALAMLDHLIADNRPATKENLPGIITPSRQFKEDGSRHWLANLFAFEGIAAPTRHAFESDVRAARPGKRTYIDYPDCIVTIE